MTPVKPKIEDILLGSGKPEDDPADLRQASSIVAEFLKSVYTQRFNSLEDLRQRLDFIPGIIQKVEQRTKKHLELGEHHMLASKFSSFASKVMGRVESAQPAIVENNSLRLPVVAHLAFRVPARVPTVLFASKPMVEQHGSLGKFLDDAYEVSQKSARKELDPWHVDEEVSFVLYEELSKIGFKTSKTRLTPTEYKEGKSNSKQLIEGMFNKWLYLWYAIPGLEIVLSILASITSKLDGLAGGLTAMTQTAKGIKEPTPQGYSPSGI